jgi:hypothetical protein
MHLYYVGGEVYADWIRVGILVCAGKGVHLYNIFFKLFYSVKQDNEVFT